MLSVFGFVLDLLSCPFPLLFAAFWAGNCHFNSSLQHFGVRTFHFPWYLQHFGARAVHVAWHFASFRVGLGLVYLAGWFRVGFRVSLIFAGWLYFFWGGGLGVA